MDGNASNSASSAKYPPSVVVCQRHLRAPVHSVAFNCQPNEKPIRRQRRLSVATQRQLPAGAKGRKETISGCHGHCGQNVSPTPVWTAYSAHTGAHRSPVKDGRPGRLPTAGNGPDHWSDASTPNQNISRGETARANAPDRLDKRFSRRPKRPTVMHEPGCPTLLIGPLLLASLSAFVGAKLINSPPKLELESPREVWFHIPTSGQPQKFALKCHASGDPERYQWFKNGRLFAVDGHRVVWQRPGQSGSITFLQPNADDKGYYQCSVSNIFGVAMSHIFDVKIGALNHFDRSPVRDVTVVEGQPLTLRCNKPYGVPSPTIFWLYRDMKKSYAMDSISRRHITVDEDGNLQFAYVDPLDANENLVYQCAATSPVLHGEYRAGDEFRLVLTKTNSRKSTSVETLWTSPEKMKLAAGSDLRLTCIFSGRPAPMIQWSKKEGELPKNRISRQNYGKTLIVHGVVRADQGTYVCDAEGRAKHETIVEVSNAPQWVNGPPEDLSLPEESNAELHCRVYGDPAPIVRWYINGQRITDFSADSRRLVSASGETLTILNLNHDIDTAVYQCNASNPLGYIFANAFVNVFAHAPRFLTEDSQTIATVVGSDVDLDCHVEAAPKPVVNWTDDKERPITTAAYGERFQILGNHSLRLLNVGMSDAGLYICNVNNKYGLNQAKRKLEVYTHSRLVTALKPRRAVIEAGTEFHLICEAEADSRLTLEYQWYRNGRQITQAANEHYRFQQPNHLVMTNPRGRHHGDYSCVARTKVDSVSSEMMLIIKDVPEAPRVLSVECNDRQALIRWAHADENFEPITKYKVEYATAFNRSLWTKTLEEDKTNQRTYEAVLNLSPWVNYTFRVIATNRRGDGEPGYSKITCNTPPSFPYTNPKNVSAAGNEKDNIVIYWQPMSKEDWNGERFRYLVRYRLDEPGAKWEEFEVEDPLQNHTVIRDQPTFRRYVVQVQAVNAIGLSLIEPHLVIGYSGEDVPTAAPKNVKISEVINSTTVVVEWDPVDADLVKGHFLGYKIFVWPIQRDTPNQTQKPLQVTAFHADRSAVIFGLEPMSTYKLAVLAFNSEHDGPQSDTLYFTTPEGTPSAVLELTVSSIGSTTIISSWQTPKNPQGRLRGYFLSFKRLDENEKEEETWVPYPRSSYMYEVAKPSTNYEVSVWGETGGGEGEKSSAVVRTWPVQDPAKPDMRVELSGSNSAQVTWLPSDSGMPGTAFYVNYSKLGTNLWQSSEVLTFPDKQVLIRDLEPNKDYAILVVAKDGDRIANSDAQYFHTVNTTVLQEVTVEQSLAGVAWFIAVVSAGSIIVVLLVVMYIVHRTRGGKYAVKEKELERGTNPDRDEERTFIEYQFGTGCSDVAP
uniref:Neuroglian n=1 Tax=Trichuris muris TaxID=70415 RepID=A0A5S6R614_TRIMR